MCAVEGTHVNRVLNASHMGGIKGIPSNMVYVGRPSMWGNEFTHRPDLAMRDGLTHVADRDAAVAAFREDLWMRIERQPALIPLLAELHGKTLVCWCAPLACHADVLVKAAAWASKQ